MRILTLLTVSLLVGCSCAETDPLGEWDLELTWGDGDCGYEGTHRSTIYIMHDETVRLSPKTDPIFYWTERDGGLVFHAFDEVHDTTLRLQVEDEYFSGTGESLFLNGEPPCSQSISAQGWKRAGLPLAAIRVPIRNNEEWEALWASRGGTWFPTLSLAEWLLTAGGEH